MAHSDSTCWTLVQGAANGAREEQERFAWRYGPVVQAYLGARWRHPPLKDEVADAAQEVFMECFRQGGALNRVERDRPGGFRAFLYGVARNIARRVEERQSGRKERQPNTSVGFDQHAADDESLTQIFDRAWAQQIMREAAELQTNRAREMGERAMKRVELLHLRFYEAMPIRDIAKRWGADAAHLHHEYAQARKEFKDALAEVVAFYQPSAMGEVQSECTRLISLLGS